MWGNKITKSCDRGLTWQCSDTSVSGEIQYIGGHWVSLRDNCTFDNGKTDFMTSDDGSSWDVTYLDVYGGTRKILFDGEQYVLITQNYYETGTFFKDKHYYYNFYSSKDLKKWSKIGDLSGCFNDLCFVDGYFHLLDTNSTGTGTSYVKAKNIKELIDKNTQKYQRRIIDACVLIQMAE